MKIYTNNHEHQFLYAYEVPQNVWEDHFAHLNPEEDVDGFFRYRNNWYHLSDFVVAPTDLAPWSGYLSDTYFSGVVIRLSNDCETYRVGTFVS